MFVRTRHRLTRQRARLARARVARAMASDKASRIASLDARMANRATANAFGARASGSNAFAGARADGARGASGTTPKRGRDARGVERAREVEDASMDRAIGSGTPSTSHYASHAVATMEELTAGARARSSGRRARAAVQDAASEDGETRRMYVEGYVRALLSTRAKGDEADAEDAVRQKLGRDKVLTLEDAKKALDAGETRRDALKKRFAQANRAKASRSSLRSRGIFGLRKEHCSWSAFAKLRAAWETYARGLVRDANRRDVRALLTRGIDLHGCVVKIVAHERQPDAVGREGVIAFVSARCLWLVSRARDDFFKVLIDGVALEYALDDRIVTLSSDDVAFSANGALARSDVK